MKDLQELTRFEDRLTYLYLEKGHIEQHQNSVAYVTENETVPIPAASLALLMLGPGTTITHAAVHNLADCNCLVAWCGDEGTRFYCLRPGRDISRQQAAPPGGAVLRSGGAAGHVVRRMYEKRFGQPLGARLDPGADPRPGGVSRAECLPQGGREVRGEVEGPESTTYQLGRRRPAEPGTLGRQRLPPRHVHAAIITAGYSPAIGFIHTGKALSFVYDMADLYKAAMIVPMVFEIVAQSVHSVEQKSRMACRDLFQDTRLLERILPDIEEVLHGGADSGTGADGAAGGPEPVDDRAEGRDIPRPYDSPPPG